MRGSGIWSVFWMGAATLYAQAPAPAAAGLETQWDIAPVIQAIGDHAVRILSALDRVDARGWMDNGASETYVAQLKSCREQAQAIFDEAPALARNPEHLAGGLTLFFRIQSVQAMLLSLEEGTRHYQNPAEANNLARIAAEDSASRNRFQLYLVNLAAAQEQQLQVMDKEAQRCRTSLIALPPRKKK